jgi:hypothetical protein
VAGVTPAPSLYVVGGQQRAPRSLLEGGDWYGYARGIVLRVDGDDVTTAASYESPPGTCAPGDPVLFKSATRRGDRLYACTQTEVVVLAVPGFEVLHHLSLPVFNDVHHVLPTDRGTVLVANSGLEMVLEVTLDGRVERIWNVLGEDPWERFSPDVDYRMGVDLKPHRAHPNHVFLVGEETWVTRFELRDAVCLDDHRRRIVIGDERVHDGVVHGGLVHFTTVDGTVVVADPETLEVVDRVRLDVPGSSESVTGWCRGLLVDGDHAWVGYSRIRATRLRQTVSWVRTGLQRSLPTRIARHRLADWSFDGEVDLEPHGLNAVFTIAPA